MSFPYGRVVVITGASSGIGLSCAELFARAGYRVWALSRRAQSSSRDTENGRITPVACDVCDETLVEAAIQHVLEIEGEIGIVLHSAGFGIAGAAEDTPVEDVRAQLETNYFGVLRVNRHVLPALRARGGGLVLVVGSVAGLLPVPYQSHYCSTKYALEAYVGALRMEGRSRGIRACILEPGDTRTGFTDARAFALPEGSPYADDCRRAVGRMAVDEQKGPAPEKAARAALRLAKRKNPPVRRVVGFSYKAMILLCRALPTRLVEWFLRVKYLRGSSRR